MKVVEVVMVVADAGEADTAIEAVAVTGVHAQIAR